MAGEIPRQTQQYLQDIALRFSQPQLSDGGGSNVGQHSQSTSQSISRSGNYFDDPALARGAAQALGGVAGQQAQGYSQFVDNPTASPAFQNALSGMLAALHPGELEGQRNLADMFRAAGNTASSSFGEAANKYQLGVDRNRAAMASDLLAKLYPQIAGAKFAPLSQVPDLINANKLEQASSQSQSQSTSTPENFAGATGLLGLPVPGAGGFTGFAQAPLPQQPNAPQAIIGGPMKWGAGF